MGQISTSPPGAPGAYDRYRRILDSCHPYVVAARYGSAAEPGELPLGLTIGEDLRFDPHRVRSGPFLNILQRLDDLTFGPIGMPMPRWVFYDCAEVPGGIFGFARPARDVPLWVRYALKVEDDYDGPVPLSMYVAIPMLEPGCWHTYTLCSFNSLAPGAGPAGLMLFTEVAGLHAFGVRTAYGVTQWRSPKLANHAHFGPLDLITAWTPAHSDPTTLTYRFPVSPERVLAALTRDVAPQHGEEHSFRWIDCDEHGELRALQAEIESGRRFQIAGPPAVQGSYTRVPVREVATP